jgi:hypothetical protein
MLLGIVVVTRMGFKMRMMMTALLVPIGPVPAGYVLIRVLAALLVISMLVPTGVAVLIVVGMLAWGKRAMAKGSSWSFTEKTMPSSPYQKPTLLWQGFEKPLYPSPLKVVLLLKYLASSFLQTLACRFQAPTTHRHPVFTLLDRHHPELTATSLKIYHTRRPWATPSALNYLPV